MDGCTIQYGSSGHTRVLQTSQGWVVRVSIMSLEVTPALSQLCNAEKQWAGGVTEGWALPPGVTRWQDPLQKGGALPPEGVPAACPR